MPAAEVQALFLQKKIVVRREGGRGRRTSTTDRVAGRGRGKKTTAAAGAGLLPSFPGVDPTQPLSDDEKKSFRSSIERLPPKKAMKVLDIILAKAPNNVLDDNGEIEIDMNRLDTPVLRELQRFVASCVGEVKGGEK